ncbi:MAG TPA: chorismate-binding protein [Acidobacteriota bacterium]|nr:chorismate-binding protein [Acidobacteriota bacterium]
MKVSAAEEPFRRGPAMGAIGWIDAGGDMELSVAIRTAVVTADRVDYHAGAGIVADSDPRAEREETMAKARAFLQALRVG